jgi:SulP family sulfate permease
MLMMSKFDLRQILPVASIGLVAGIIQLPLAISFAILIFSGEPASFASMGIGMVLFGGLIMQLIIALTSSVPGMVGGPQDSPSAIMGVAALAIAANMEGASAEAKFITVVMVVMLTSVLSGLLFVLIGGFKLSRLVRFIPYPVVGGFVAGTGLLLAKGGFGVLLGNAPTLANLGTLFTPQNLLSWVPGFLFGVAVLLASRRSTHFLTYPALLVGAVLLFYLVLLVSGHSVQYARDMVWLLGPFPHGTLWKPLNLSLLGQINWHLVTAQSGNMIAVAVISLVALLLNASALELIAQKDIDLNRELISTGVANIAGGLVGSPAGYHYLGVSSLAFRMKISSRMVSLFCASVTVLALLFGASLLSLIPKLIVGGLILFVGLSFLTEWLYDAWFQLPRIDYALVWVILIVVGVAGFLEGVGTGIVIAILLFVVNYSRIDIVKDSLTGETYRSSTELPLEQRQLIQRLGQQIEILRLQGFVFFGTSQSLVRRINDRLKDSNLQKMRYLILDFQHVSALDSSAVFSFVRLKQLADTYQFFIVLTDVDQATKIQLRRAGLQDEDARIRFFPSMDYGMEWCESKMLVDEGGSAIIRSGSLLGQLKKLFPSSKEVDKFMLYLEKEEVQEYHIVINRGDEPDCMYFVDSGHLTTRLEISEGKFIRLMTQGGGTMMGEIGLFLHQPRTATVVADQPSTLYRLSISSYNKMMHDEPDLALHLHQWIGRVLSTRLAENTQTLEVLLS